MSLLARAASCGACTAVVLQLASAVEQTTHAYGIARSKTTGSKPQLCRCWVMDMRCFAPADSTAGTRQAMQQQHHPAAGGALRSSWQQRATTGHHKHCSAALGEHMPRQQLLSHDGICKQRLSVLFCLQSACKSCSSISSPVEVCWLASRHTHSQQSVLRQPCCTSSGAAHPQPFLQAILAAISLL